tara:strand:- start:295 stop:1137 length:843 start_codon:yes stop_codon:yes gene_type:complete
MTKHNKKRNIGIMYELLLRHISDRLIDGDKRGAEKATKIIETRFAKNTELYKEFRLFNALAKTSVHNTEIAAAILTEAKNAARRFDAVALEREKSALIRDVNYKINDSSFYYRSVPDYRELANIHNMIREWEKGDRSDLKKMVLFEQKALNSLLAEKKTEDRSIESSSHDLLTEKIMMNKINKKYTDMSKVQKTIIQKYALYSQDVENHDKLRNFLSEKKKECLSNLKSFEKVNQNSHLSEKINLVEGKVESLDVSILNDQTVAKFLTLSKLIEEIKSGE